MFTELARDDLTILTQDQLLVLRQLLPTLLSILAQPGARDIIYLLSLRVSSEGFLLG